MSVTAAHQSWIMILSDIIIYIFVVKIHLAMFVMTHTGSAIPRVILQIIPIWSILTKMWFLQLWGDCDLKTEEPSVEGVTWGAMAELIIQEVINQSLISYLQVLKRISQWRYGYNKLSNNTPLPKKRFVTSGILPVILSKVLSCFSQIDRCDKKIISQLLHLPKELRIYNHIRSSCSKLFYPPASQCRRF